MFDEGKSHATECFYVAIPVSSSNDQQDHRGLSIWDALIQRCATDARELKSLIFVSEWSTDQDLWEWEISKSESTTK